MTLIFYLMLLYTSMQWIDILFNLSCCKKLSMNGLQCTWRWYWILDSIIAMESVWKFANIYTSNGSRFGNLSNREGAEWQKFLILSPPNILLLCPSPGVGSSANFGDGPELTTRDPIVWKCGDRPSCRHLSTTHQQSISTKISLPSVFFAALHVRFQKIWPKFWRKNERTVEII